jgi:hypothetical protein
MRKGWIVFVTAVLVAVLAVPAMADITASGFYRSKAYLGNFNTAAGNGNLRTGQAASPETTFAYVEQRMRMKFEFGTENVKAVYFGEIDFATWGDTSGVVNRNQGGALGGDSINLESKNVYLWFKIPDTGVDFTVGLQNVTDDYAGVLYGAADMAGILMNGKLEPVKFRLGWFKLYETATDKADDATLYTASVKFVPAKDVSLGVNFDFLQDDTGTNPANTKLNPFDNQVAPPWLNSNYKLKLYTPGVSATFKAGPAALSGFAFYQWGKFEGFRTTGPDVDVKAYGADLRAEVNAGPAKVFLEGLYLSGGDKNDEYNSPIGLGDYQGTNTGPGGNSSYTRTRMQIMLSSWDAINTAQCIVGCSGGVYGDSLGVQGRGLWHVAGGAAMNATPKLQLEANVGYAQVVKMRNNESSWRDKDLGFEANAGVSYNIAKGLDFGLYGAYMWLGGFVVQPTTPPTTTSTDFKDPYTTYARINYAF